MKAEWENLSAKVEALTVRERVILLSTMVVAVLFIWGQFFFTPLQERNKQASSALRAINIQQTELMSQVSVLDLQLAEDPNRELIAQRKGLEQQLEKTKAEIERQLSGLIAPDKMADVLRTLLIEEKKLKLISLKNLPVKPFNFVDESVEKEGTALFSHSMELVVDGQYFEVLAYIKRLEQFKGFNWDMLSYDVVDYPNARVTVKISTLSLEEDWIGV